MVKVITVICKPHFIILCLACFQFMYWSEREVFTLLGGPIYMHVYFKSLGSIDLFFL